MAKAEEASLVAAAEAGAMIKAKEEKRAAAEADAKVKGEEARLAIEAESKAQAKEGNAL
jgi:hypothetical protein